MKQQINYVQKTVVLSKVVQAHKSAINIFNSLFSQIKFKIITFDYLAERMD